MNERPSLEQNDAKIGGVNCSIPSALAMRNRRIFSLRELSNSLHKGEITISTHCGSTLTQSILRLACLQQRFTRLSYRFLGKSSSLFATHCACEIKKRQARQ